MHRLQVALAAVTRISGVLSARHRAWTAAAGVAAAGISLVAELPAVVAVMSGVLAVVAIAALLSVRVEAQQRRRRTRSSGDAVAALLERGRRLERHLPSLMAPVATLRGRFTTEDDVAAWEQQVRDVLAAVPGALERLDAEELRLDLSRALGAMQQPYARRLRRLVDGLERVVAQGDVGRSTPALRRARAS